MPTFLPAVDPTAIRAVTLTAIPIPTATWTVVPTPTPTLTPVPTIAPTSTRDLPPTVVDNADVLIDCAVSLADDPIRYGTNGWWTDQDAELWRVRYAELAPEIVRVPLLHQFLEPVNDNEDADTPNWSGFWFDKPIPLAGRTVTYRRWFEALRDLDVTLMLYVPYLAGWLSANGDQSGFATYPPNSMPEYTEFIWATLQYLVQEIDYPPERIIVETSNEPDLECGRDTAVPCFWANWSMDDLVNVVRAMRQVCDRVDPAVRLIGLSTCCGNRLVDQFMSDHDGARILDGLSYHRYLRGFDQNEVVQLGQRLAQWGLPIYLTEYGSTKYWSDGEAGALWHAAALAQIWPEAIAPIQFSMSEFPGMHEGYNRLGLSADWTASWEKKPAYQVYVDFARYLGPSVPVSVKTRSPLIVAAGQGKHDQVSVWIVNPSQDDQSGVVFQLRGITMAAAVIDVYAMAGNGDPASSFTVTGTPLSFSYDVPAQSGWILTLSPAHDTVESSYE